MCCETRHVSITGFYFSGFTGKFRATLLGWYLAVFSVCIVGYYILRFFVTICFSLNLHLTVGDNIFDVKNISKHLARDISP